MLLPPSLITLSLTTVLLLQYHSWSILVERSLPCSVTVYPFDSGSTISRESSGGAERSLSCYTSPPWLITLSLGTRSLVQHYLRSILVEGSLSCHTLSSWLVTLSLFTLSLIQHRSRNIVVDKRHELEQRVKLERPRSGLSLERGSTKRARHL